MLLFSLEKDSRNIWSEATGATCSVYHWGLSKEPSSAGTGHPAWSIEAVRLLPW